MDRHLEACKRDGNLCGRRKKREEKGPNVIHEHINEGNKYNTLNSHCGSAVLSHSPGKAVILVEGNERNYYSKRQHE